MYLVKEYFSVFQNIYQKDNNGSVKGSKWEGFSTQEAEFKEQASEEGSGILVTSPRWCLTADVKNEKGKISRDILKKGRRWQNIAPK